MTFSIFHEDHFRVTTSNDSTSGSTVYGNMLLSVTSILISTPVLTMTGSPVYILGTRTYVTQFSVGLIRLISSKITPPQRGLSE